MADGKNEKQDSNAGGANVNPDRERATETEPVHIAREYAQRNIPPDPDPDDPVSP